MTLVDPHLFHVLRVFLNTFLILIQARDGAFIAILLLDCYKKLSVIVGLSVSVLSHLTDSSPSSYNCFGFE